MTTETDQIWVEVVYAAADEQYLQTLRVAAGSTARDVLLQSSLPARFPEVDFACAPIGIFGKRVADDIRLQADDRVEVYRPLLIDPKENRRRRAQRQD